MVKIENDCCGCATENYPCLGDACDNRHREHYYCDDCGDETMLYWCDGSQLCANCVLKTLEEVEGSGD